MRRVMGIRLHMGDTDYTDVIEDFKRSGQFPLLWQLTARDFISAANHLRRTHEMTSVDADATSTEANAFTSKRPMLLLYGLGLENLLKGLLVSLGTDATSTGRLNNRLKTHDLLSLWREAGLALTSDAEEVLGHLHWSVEPAT